MFSRLLARDLGKVLFFFEDLHFFAARTERKNVNLLASNLTVAIQISHRIASLYVCRPSSIWFQNPARSFHMQTGPRRFRRQVCSPPCSRGRPGAGSCVGDPSPGVGRCWIAGGDGRCIASHPSFKSSSTAS
jgi:hypothetical protein